MAVEADRPHVVCCHSINSVKEVSVIEPGIGVGDCVPLSAVPVEGEEVIASCCGGEVVIAHCPNIIGGNG